MSENGTFIKKGPFVHDSLLKRVRALNSRNEKRV